MVFNQSPSPPPLQESEALSQGNAGDEAEMCTKLGSVKHNRVRVRAPGYLPVLSSSDPPVCSTLTGSREGRNAPAASQALCPRRPGSQKSAARKRFRAYLCCSTPFKNGY